VPSKEKKKQQPRVHVSLVPHHIVQGRTREAIYKVVQI
jgi:hypothetical protein